MILHQIQAYGSFLTTLTKFYPKLTHESDRKPNFDSIVKMDWNQFHYKQYWIPFPMTTHGSKLELKRLRYLENRAGCIILLFDAITFDLIVWFSKLQVIWKLDFHTFPVVPIRMGKGLQMINQSQTRKARGKDKSADVSKSNCPRVR